MEHGTLKTGVFVILIIYESSYVGKGSGVCLCCAVGRVRRVLAVAFCAKIVTSVRI